MNCDPLHMTDAEVIKAHQLALKKQRQWSEAIDELEWHMKVREHIKKQSKINRLNDMKAAVAALEAEIDRAT